MVIFAHVDFSDSGRGSGVWVQIHQAVPNHILGDVDGHMAATSCTEWYDPPSGEDCTCPAQVQQLSSRAGIHCFNFLQ